MRHEPIEHYDNAHHLMCNRCHKKFAEFQGTFADGFPRAVVCRECLIEIVDYAQGMLSL